MSPRKFDRFMVDVNVGTNRKLRRLNPQERWCALAGVFAIAAVSPIRGALLIADGPAEAVDYAEQAGVSLPIANATLKKLRNMGVVYEADDGDFERVHDFEDWNPAPRNDPTAAERMRRYRERLARNGSRVTERNDRNVTERNGDGVTPGREEKVEEKTPPNPPRGERQRDKDQYREQLVEYVAPICLEYPDTPPAIVAQVVEQAIRWGKARTTADVLAFCDRHEQLTRGAA